MHLDDFLWLPDVIEKLIVKHRVSQDKVEEVFFNDPQYRFVEKGYRQGEDVYAGTNRCGTVSGCVFHPQIRQHRAYPERARYGPMGAKTL